MPKKEILPTGTLRIKAKDCKVYRKKGSRWEKTSILLPEAKKVIRFFKACKNFNLLVDKNNAIFLKGQLSPSGKTQGARLSFLPNGKTVDKAYSLFAQRLTLHDERSGHHWDVIFQQPSGKFAYCYTLEKKQQSVKAKYKKVADFGKHYLRLTRNVAKAINDKNDTLAMPMHTLLKTYMRIGNEIYYKAHKHKGLSTLKKNDIRIKRKKVTFTFLGKDGVPQHITKTFSDSYVKRLRSMLRSLHQEHFIFANTSGHPLHEAQFKKAFKQYCGKEYYPHIVRSYHATKKAKDFLKHRRSATKEEVQTLFLSIADALGHKKFNKEKDEWQDSYTVTIHHYIQPELVEKVRSLIK